MIIGAANDWAHIPRFTDRGQMLLAFLRRFVVLPSSPSALAKVLHVSRETARLERDSLLDPSRHRKADQAPQPIWVEQRDDGQLVLTRAAEEAFDREVAEAASQAGHPGLAVLPGAWLDAAAAVLSEGDTRGAKKIRTCPGRSGLSGLNRAEQLAAAELFADAQPAKSARAGCRGDRERAETARVDRSIVADAREKLCRAFALAWRRDLIDRRLYIRHALPGTEGFVEGEYKKAQKQTVRSPEKSAARKLRTRQTAKEVGRTHPDEWVSEVPIIVHGSNRDRDAKAVDQVVVAVARSKSVKSSRGERALAGAAADAVARIYHLALDRRQLDELGRQPAAEAVGQVLRLAGYCDLERRRREREASELAEKGVTFADAAVLVFDVLLTKRRSTVGAVLRDRVRRLLSGQRLEEVLDRSRRGLSLGAFVERVTDQAPEDVRARHQARTEHREMQIGRTARPSPTGDPRWRNLIVAIRHGEATKAQVQMASLLASGLLVDRDLVAHHSDVDRPRVDALLAAPAIQASSQSAVSA